MPFYRVIDTTINIQIITDGQKSDTSFVPLQILITEDQDEVYFRLKNAETAQPDLCMNLNDPSASGRIMKSC